MSIASIRDSAGRRQRRIRSVMSASWQSCLTCWWTMMRNFNKHMHLQVLLKKMDFFSKLGFSGGVRFEQ